MSASIAVIKAALEMRETGLQRLASSVFCKTTGGKGLHVVTPLAQEKNTELDWPVAQSVRAARYAARMAQAAPDNYLLNMSKNERKGTNIPRLPAKMIASRPPWVRYHLEAREGAPVSMPVHWSQMRIGFDPLKYTIRTAPGLLAKNKPWERLRRRRARSLVSAIQKITNTEQVSLDDTLAEGKPRRRAARQSVRGARKGRKEDEHFASKQAQQFGEGGWGGPLAPTKESAAWAQGAQGGCEPPHDRSR